MPEASATNGAGGTAGTPSASPGSGNAGARAHLEGLLAEVTALANQLRKTSAGEPRQDNSPQGGWTILQTLGRLGPQTVPDIARARATSRQNIQVLVNRLESQGYVTMTPNPAHKRSLLVEIAERGRQSLATVMGHEAASLEALLPHVPQSRLVPAARLLRRLRELLGGKGLPMADIVEERLIPKSASSSSRSARRAKRAAASTALPPPPEPVEPDEGELPVSLL